MSKLTAVQVRNIKSTDKPFTVADGGGLSLHVAPSGVLSWRYRYRYNGKATTQVLGKYPEMSLAEARTTHQKSRAILGEGVNPTAEKKIKKLEEEQKSLQETIKAKNTFQAVAEDWIEQQGGEWSYNHRKAVLKTLERDAFALIGGTRIDTLTAPEILEVIRAIEARDSYEIASKVLQRISAVCRYAVQTGMAMYNPAAEMRGVLKTRRVVHRAALQENELPEFILRLHKSNEHVITKAALLFTIHTAARTGEVRFATWKEIDLPSREWRIPADRMKMKIAHTVPLTDQTMMILAAMKAHAVDGDNGLIFPGIKTSCKPLSENTMLYAMYRLGYHSRATVHGFRAVFSTIANESGLFDKDAIERQLAHQERNKVRGAYHRSEYKEERKKMMQWWSNYLEELRGKE